LTVEEGAPPVPLLVAETVAAALVVEESPPAPAVTEADMPPAPAAVEPLLEDATVLPPAPTVVEEEAPLLAEAVPPPAPAVEVEVPPPTPAVEEAEVLPPTPAVEEVEALPPTPAVEEAEALPPTPAVEEVELLPPTPAVEEVELLPPTPVLEDEAEALLLPVPSSQTAPVNVVQIPSAVAPRATEHASQLPALQAVLQQTPSTHTAPWHEALVEHGWPSGGGVVQVISTLAVPQIPSPVGSPKPTSRRPSGRSVVVFPWRFATSMVPNGDQVSVSGS
jgi:hypothetical protein